MAEDLYWVVYKDTRGKWAVQYDPKHGLKFGKRFRFEAYATEYQKKMTKADAAATAALKARQGELIPGDSDE